jgi:hypothetical protein
LISIACRWKTLNYLSTALEGDLRRDNCVEKHAYTYTDRPKLGDIENIMKFMIRQRGELARQKKPDLHEQDEEEDELDDGEEGEEDGEEEGGGQEGVGFVEVKVEAKKRAQP